MPSGPLDAGTILNGRYRVVRAIGRGGMGRVYLAEHMTLGAVVAIKEVRGLEAGDNHQDALERCVKEARFLVRLAHSNLPKVTDAFVENDRFYLVMEYIEGVTLESRLTETGPYGLNVREVVDWGLQISDVLAYLHSQLPPIIFRDLKPSNVMVRPDGSIRLIDFGIARNFQPGVERDTSLLGSVGYSPPEQFGREQTDTRSDIYAFGATLHHLLTGRDPSGEPFKFPPAQMLNPAVPVSLSRAISASLAVDRDDRPASVQEIAAALLGAREQLADRLRSPTGDRAAVTGAASARAAAVSAGRAGSGLPPPAEGRRRRTRWSRTVIGSSGVALVAGGVALALTGGAHHARHRPTVPARLAAMSRAPAPEDTPSIAGSPASPQQGAALPVAPPAAGIDMLAAEGIEPDDAGGYDLRLLVAGHVAGQVGQAGSVAVFFFDGAGKPVPARDTQSPYASGDGQLSVAQPLLLTADTMPFSTSLDLPLAQFPAALADQAVRCRASLFLGGQKVAGTDFVAVNFALPIPPAAGDTPVAPAPDVETAPGQ